MIILFNGCSHSEGAGVPNTQTWSNIVFRSIFRSGKFIAIRESVNQNMTAYKKLEFLRSFNLENESDPIGISLARSGKGNDAILYETIEAIEHLKSINKKPKLVCIQWSGPNRRVIQHISRYEEVYYVNPNDGSPNLIPMEPLASKQSITYIKCLETYLKSNNIDYIFIPFMEFDPDDNYKSTKTYKSLDFEKIIISNGEFGKFRLNFLKNNLAIDSVGHPSALANWIMAGKIVEKLNLNVIGFFDFFKITSDSSNNHKKIGSNIRIEYIQNTKLNKHSINSIDSQFKKANKSILKIYKVKKLH
jgi:hypothetical protein